MTLGSPARRTTVLIVLHQEHSTPGRIGIALKALDVRLDIRRPSCGEPLPDRLADHDGVVVFGGPMGVNDTLDWVRREIKWLETPLAEDKPLLGLCLGAQMLARALGARVFSYDDKRSEIGYYPIEPTLIGGRLCPAPFPRTVYWRRWPRLRQPSRDRRRSSFPRRFFPERNRTRVSRLRPHRPRWPPGRRPAPA
jgi:GMP synthase (glutamine-hydrolysing)